MVGIEADGGQHYEFKSKERDENRAEELKKLGVKIIRFSDLEILTNIDGVYEIIRKILKKRRRDYPPHLNPLPIGERKQE